MADNVTAAGVPVSTDEVPGGVHVQKMKLLDGTPDSTAPIPGTSADGLYVDVRQVRVPVNVVGPATNAELRATPLPVSGTVNASGPVTDAQLRAAPVPVSGPLTDTQLRAAGVPTIPGVVPNASITSVPATVAAGGTAIAANANRRGLLIENNSGQKMRIKYGAGVSGASYTVSLKAGGYWEMPSPIFAGVVSLLWDAADPGNAMVTELTV